MVGLALAGLGLQSVRLWPGDQGGPGPVTTLHHGQPSCQPTCLLSCDYQQLDQILIGIDVNKNMDTS